MSLGPSSFLDGPRGRRLCLEVLLDEARRSDTAEARDAVHAVFWAAHAVAENPGTLIHIGRGAQSFAEPDVSPAEAAAALEGLRVPEITGEGLARALSVAVDLAAYWQPPSGEDALAATPEVRRVLEPVADVIVRSAQAAWWESPVAREEQAAVAWEDETFAVDDPGETLSRWRAAMAADELQFAAYRDVSGPWWSTPPFALTRTTRVRERGEALGLTLVEDSLGWASARTRRVTPPAGRVIEVDGPDAWAELCLRHPLVVTASRRTVWEWTTGRDGVWVVPDWAAVAREAVGVHLTVAGYLTCAGRVIDLGDAGASTVAGWGPDETFWFRAPSATAAPERWSVDRGTDDGRWHPA